MTIKLLCSLFAILLSPVFALGQVKDIEKFSHLRVSRDLRERLAERFNLFVEYERTGRYEQQYDLLADEARRNMQRNEYADNKRMSERATGQLLELKIRGIGRKLNDGEWVRINVQVRLRLNSRTYSDYPTVVAYLRNGEWYFSMAYIDV